MNVHRSAFLLLKDKPFTPDRPIVRFDVFAANSSLASSTFEFFFGFFFTFFKLGLAFFVLERRNFDFLEFEFLSLIFFSFFIFVFFSIPLSRLQLFFVFSLNFSFLLFLFSSLFLLFSSPSEPSFIFCVLELSSLLSLPAMPERWPFFKTRSHEKRSTFWFLKSNFSKLSVDSGDGKSPKAGCLFGSFRLLRLLSLFGLARGLLGAFLRR